MVAHFQSQRQSGSFSFLRGHGCAFPGQALRGGFEVGGGKALGGFPEAFKFVIAAGFFRENVDDEVDVVEQDPLGLTITLYMRGVKAVALQAELDLIGDGLNLARIGAAADYEIVGEGARTFFELEDCDFFGLFFLAGSDGFGDLALGVGGLHAVWVVGSIFDCNRAASKFRWGTQIGSGGDARIARMVDNS